MLIRCVFNEGAAQATERLQKHLPNDVAEHLNVQYAASDPDAYFDVFWPETAAQSMQALPTVVWVHGGGWVSGSRKDLDSYAKILASRGFTVVSVGYSIAPEAKYPTPVRQVNEALGFVTQNAVRLHADAGKIFLAGDSAGAQIAAQEANLVSVPKYATDVGIVPAIERRQLAGAVLFCGAYDAKLVKQEGLEWWFVHTVLWSYSGRKNFMKDSMFARMSVLDYVTGAFPPVFISAGNADPLEAQSRVFAQKLTRLGVSVDALFYPKHYAPALGHEYQMNLDTDAGRLAPEQCVAFLKKESGESRNSLHDP